MASGNGGGAIALEVSPLVSSASESDVGLTHKISTTPASTGSSNLNRYMPCVVCGKTPLLQTSFVRASSLARRENHQTLVLPLYVVLVFLL